MVFTRFEASKRRSQLPKVKVRVLTNLPAELLLEILSYLSTFDVLRLRQTCQSIGPACVTTMKARLRILYIHPSKTSLRNVSAICNSGLSDEIDEVCLVGKMQPGYYDPSNAPENPNHVLRRAGKFLQWPSRLPTADGSPNMHDFGPGRENPGLLLLRMKTAYKAITDAFALLPRLTKVSFADNCVIPGYNRVAKHQIDSHSHRYKPRRTCPDDSNALRAWVSPNTSSEWRFSDEEILLCVLFSEHVNAQELKLSIGLGSSPPQIFWKKSDASKALLHLRRFETYVGGFYMHPDWIDFNKKILTHMRNLKELVVNFGRNSMNHAGETDSSLGSLLGSLPYHRYLGLEQLQILHLKAELPKGYAGNVRSSRPIFEDIDLARILPNLPALEGLLIDNVTFLEFGPSFPKFLAVNIQDSTRSVIKWARNGSNKLRLFDWKVSRFSRDFRCKKSDQDVPHRCKYQCGLYSSVYLHGENESLADMTRLADEICVEPQEDGHFQFGGGLKNDGDLEDRR